MSPLLADQTLFIGLLCALPFVGIALVPISIIVFNITLWLRDRRPRR
jgi:hypothetical protein